MKAFQDLQHKYSEKLSYFRQLRQKVQLLEKEKKIKEFTLKHVQSLPKGTVTYNSIGKMFLAAPAETIEQDLKNSITKFQDEINQLEVMFMSNKQKEIGNI